MKYNIYSSVFDGSYMNKTFFADNTLVSSIVARDTLDESLSQCKLTLLLATSQEFEPYTRFFIDIYSDSAVFNTDKPLKHLDYIVETDIVDHYALTEKLWLHQLNLIESSASAQAIILPNCSLTWELEDTMVRYSGAIPQGLAQQLDTDGYRNKHGNETSFPDTPFDQLKNLTQSGYVQEMNGSAKVNIDRPSPIICASTDTTYSFTYNIPKMYLDLTYYFYKYTGFAGFGECAMSYTWRGQKELSTITIMYVDGVENTRTYHDGDNALFSKDGNKKFFYDKVGWFSTDNDTGDLVPSFNTTSTVTSNASCSDRLNYHTPSGAAYTLNFNTNRIDNYNTGASLDIITIDLLALGFKDKLVKFKTYPVVKLFDVNNGEFLTTYQSFENPTFSGQIRLDKSSSDHSYLPMSDENFNLTYSYSIKATKSTYKDTKLLVSASPYNAYEMFNKLQVSYLNIMDSGETDNQLYSKLPYQFDDNLYAIAIKTIVPEVSFAQKSLMQALFFLCSFMGGLPKIEAQVDSPQFIVHLDKLGGNIETNYGNLISIYNSKHMSEYVTEIKTEYQNMINSTGLLTEIIHPVAQNETEYFSVDNISLRTSFPIDRVATIEVYNILNAARGWQDCTDLFFSEQVYNMLAGFYSLSTSGSEQYDGTIPNKGMCLYYTHGSNEIKGLQYKCPEQYNSPTSLNNTNCYAIKNFLWAVYNRDGDGLPGNPYRETPNNKGECYAINPSNYIFRIRYVAIVDSEISSIRPDLRKYFINSSLSNYPSYQQRSQASEYFIEAYKLGNKNYGELIRQSNTVYEVEDWFEDITKIHNCGEIYKIDNLYYINSIETEYATTFVQQHISLSKDFNRLSQYIGLDSASRWYKVPEAYCNRTINQKAFIYLYTKYDQSNPPIIGSNKITKYGEKALWQYILKKKQNYPTSAEITFVSDNFYSNGANSSTVVLPVATLPVGSSLSMCFSCKDNFSPGTAYIKNGNFMNTTSTWSRKKMITSNGGQDVIISDNSNDGSNEQAYWFPVNDSYCDLNGRVKTCKIDIGEMFKTNSTVYNSTVRDDIYCLPLTNTQDFQNTNKYLGSTNKLDENNKIVKVPSFFVYKDAGEKLLFLLSVILETGSDRFSFSRYLWETNSNIEPTGCKWVALSKEITKFDEPSIADSDVVSTYGGTNPIDAETLFDYDNGVIKISTWLKTLTDEQIYLIKSIALVVNTQDTASYLFQRPILYRNLGGLTETENGTKIKDQIVCDWLFDFR